jgi:hypothetical protein
MKNASMTVAVGICHSLICVIYLNIFSTMLLYQLFFSLCYKPKKLSYVYLFFFFPPMIQKVDMYFIFFWEDLWVGLHFFFLK